MRRLLATLAAVLAMAVPAARAQVVDNIEVRRLDATHAQVEIRFTVPVQFLRSATNTKKDLVQVFFRLAGAESDGSRTVEDFRRSPPSDLVPRFTVTYPIQQPAVTRRIDIQFERPVNVRVRAGRDRRSLVLEMPVLARAAPATPAAPAAPPAPAAAAPTPSADIAAKAVAWLAEARAALDAARTDEAIDKLNALLNLPPNPSSREAQELIGVARERRGEPAKARAEYELFLKLYPKGADADRVRQRLAALGTAAPAAAAAVAPPAAQPPRTQVWGSLAQGYYGGKSHSDTQLTTITPATNATTIDTQSLSATEQSEILTTIDLNARYSAGAWDHRFVFRDTHGLSFLSGQPNGNRLIALYGESRHAPTQSLVRVGRQYSAFGGVLGRFDGVLAGTGITQGVRVNFVGGRPADLVGDLKPSFYGMLLELDSPALRWSGNVYGVEQRLDGRTDRRAAGGEVRYFDSERSLLASADYDVSFRALDVATVQATWQVRPGTMLNALGDYRRTPSLQLSNALLTGRNLTLSQLIETFGETQARDEARAVTPVSKVVYAGVTQQLGNRWQVGADVRISSLSSVPEVGLLPASPGTGTIYTYSTQLIGNALWGLNDVAVLNLSALTGASRNGFSAGFTQRVQLRERWVLEPSLRYYRQHDDVGVRLTRWSPGIKFSYRLRDHMQLEAEWTADRAHTVGPVVDDRTTRHFFFLGYRWDF